MIIRSRSGLGRTGIILILAVILVVGIVFAIMATRPPSPKTFEVSDVSLNPSEINVNSHATLTFSIKNGDPSKSHSLTVIFNASSVTLYSGGAPLPVGNDGLQHYQIEIQSSQTSFGATLNVTATLTGGSLTSTYPIHFDFYDDNNVKFDSETVNLKVDLSG